MTTQENVVVVRILRHPDGMFEATSRDLAGVCIVHDDLEKLIGDMPNVVKLWYKLERNMDIEVFRGDVLKSAGNVTIPVIPLPVEIAAAALAR